MTIVSEKSNFDLRKKEVRIRLRIPKKFQGDPVISQLTSKYNLQVNIVQAILGANGEGDGWFDLLIQGKQEEIDSALIYLSELDVEILNQSNKELAMNNYQDLQFFYGLPIKMQLKMKVPHIYRQQPVIYNLIVAIAYGYNLDVKILEGNLGFEGNNDAFFNIELTGIKERIASALNYISSLNIDFSQYQNINYEEDKKMTIVSEKSDFDLRKKEVRIKLRIPKKFQGEPVISQLTSKYSFAISQLTSKYNLQVNIIQAILGSNGEVDGWFDLLITGKQEQVDNGLIYLSELGVEILSQSNSEIDGW